MSLFTEPTLEEMAQIFAMSEEEQEVYFPHFDKEVWIEFGPFQTGTQYAKFVALCALNYCGRKAQLSKNSELSQLGTELCGLAFLVLESSAHWEYLVWHPREVRLGNAAGISVDSDIYMVWAVIRRLCKEVLTIKQSSRAPRPFYECFQDFIVPSRSI